MPMQEQKSVLEESRIYNIVDNYKSNSNRDIDNITGLFKFQWQSDHKWVDFSPDHNAILLSAYSLDHNATDVELPGLSQYVYDLESMTQTDKYNSNNWLNIRKIEIISSSHQDEHEFSLQSVPTTVENNTGKSYKSHVTWRSHDSALSSGGATGVSGGTMNNRNSNYNKSNYTSSHIADSDIYSSFPTTTNSNYYSRIPDSDIYSSFPSNNSKYSSHVADSDIYSTFATVNSNNNNNNNNSYNNNNNSNNRNMSNKSHMTVEQSKSYSAFLGNDGHRGAAEDGSHFAAYDGHVPTTSPRARGRRVPRQQV